MDWLPWEGMFKEWIDDQKGMSFIIAGTGWYGAYKTRVTGVQYKPSDFYV